MTKSLIVFTGKPGSGKTTLIKHAFKEVPVVDVLPFVKAYEIKGTLPENKTLEGYKDMYHHITGMSDQVIILEVGTNHPEFNVSELEKINISRKVKIFLCDASVETCYKRVRTRGERTESDEAIKKRIERDFPNSHLNILKSFNLQYFVIDMERDIQDIINGLKNIIPL